MRREREENFKVKVRQSVKLEKVDKLEVEEKICVKQKSKMDKSPKRVTRQLVSEIL